MRENRTCSLGGGRRLARERASSDPTNQMSKDEGGRNSSFSEKPVRSRLRRLVDWINPAGLRRSIH